MNVSSLDSIQKAASSLLNNNTLSTKQTEDKSGAFDALLQSAMNMINETNDYTKLAEEAELSYAMGLNTNTHELQVAQQKANISLQFTVAVRNAVLDAYKEIMQLQF